LNVNEKNPLQWVGISMVRYWCYGTVLTSWQLTPMRECVMCCYCFRINVLLEIHRVFWLSTSLVQRNFCPKHHKQICCLSTLFQANLLLKNPYLKHHFCPPLFQENFWKERVLRNLD
jgi:hypothetical protein